MVVDSGGEAADSDGVAGGVCGGAAFLEAKQKAAVIGGLASLLAVAVWGGFVKQGHTEQNASFADQKAEEAKDALLIAEQQKLWLRALLERND